MQHDEFVGQVQARARLDSRGAAEGAIRATLETLSERLSGGLPEKIGAQLPPELGRHLSPGQGESFQVDEFCRRVAERGPASAPAEAALHARAVLCVIDEAKTGNLLERIREQLTPEWEDLFDFSLAR